MRRLDNEEALGWHDGCLEGDISGEAMDDKLELLLLVESKTPELVSRCSERSTGSTYSSEPVEGSTLSDQAPSSMLNKCGKQGSGR